MSKPSFGRLEKVALRQGWSHEATEFTPWLAHDENIKLLGDAIGLELEVETTEKNVGPFSADILCKDTVEDTWVLVENQLERTDHRHLGQLLTYAAGLEAVTIIWIAKRFTDEHRAALDWLNGITEKGIDFFGIEIELWRIADSPVAPKFNLVSKPNNWQKTVAQAARRQGDLTDTRQQQLAYWTSFTEYLEESDAPVRPPTPHARHWVAYAIGRSGAHLETRVYLSDNRIEVSVECKHPEDATALFYALKSERDAIEHEIGSKLEWREKPNTRRCQIVDAWEADLSDQTDWPSLHEEMAARLNGFYHVFSPRIKAFNADDWTMESDTGGVGGSKALL
jgi:hypothetical protein